MQTSWVVFSQNAADPAPSSLEWFSKWNRFKGSNILWWTQPTRRAAENLSSFVNFLGSRQIYRRTGTACFRVGINTRKTIYRRSCNNCYTRKAFKRGSKKPLFYLIDMAKPVSNVTHQKTVTYYQRSNNKYTPHPPAVLSCSIWMVSLCQMEEEQGKGESKISRKVGTFPAFDLFLQNISRNVKEI